MQFSDFILFFHVLHQFRHYCFLLSSCIILLNNIIIQVIFPYDLHACNLCEGSKVIYIHIERNDCSQTPHTSDKVNNNCTTIGLFYHKHWDNAKFRCNRLAHTYKSALCIMPSAIQAECLQPIQPMHVRTITLKCNDNKHSISTTVSPLNNIVQFVRNVYIFSQFIQKVQVVECHVYQNKQSIYQEYYVTLSLWWPEIYTYPIQHQVIVSAGVFPTYTLELELYSP